MKEILTNIQTSLVAPKSQINKFGNYKYRSCEDILEALKPLLKENKVYVTLNDEIISIGNRFYVKATATIHGDNGKSVSVTAYAREAETKKGNDESQITGAASSYARKYALNGLFCIDDTKDADSINGNTSAPSSSGVINEKQLHELRDLLISTNGNEAKFCAWLKIEALDKLTDNDFPKALQALKVKASK